MLSLKVFSKCSVISSLKVRKAKGQEWEGLQTPWGRRATETRGRWGWKGARPGRVLGPRGGGGISVLGRGGLGGC